MIQTFNELNYSAAMFENERENRARRARREIALTNR